MSRTLLPLTPNTPPEFNLDYAHTTDRDFLGVVLFELNADENAGGELQNEYFKYMNLRAFPRVMDQFINENPLERELTRDDRLKDYQLVIDMGEEPRAFKVFARWAKGCRSDYMSTLCGNLSNEMRMPMMNEASRMDHYENHVLQEYDGKILRNWEIAQFIPDRQLWWTRKNVERYLTDEVARIDPLPELAKGPYANDEDMMSLTAPPVDRATDFSTDDDTDDTRDRFLSQPSPVKVQDLIDGADLEKEMAELKAKREQAKKDKSKQPDNDSADARHLARAARIARERLREAYPHAVSSSSDGSVTAEQQVASTAGSSQSKGAGGSTPSEDESSQNEDDTTDNGSNNDGSSAGNTNGNGNSDHSGNGSGSGSGGEGNGDDQDGDEEETNNDEEEEDENDGEEEENLEEEETAAEDERYVSLDEEVVFQTPDNEPEGSLDTDAEQTDKEEGTSTAASCGLLETLCNLRNQFRDTLDDKDLASAFEKPDALDDDDEPSGTFEMHQYLCMRELMDTLPYLIRTTAKQELRQAMIDKGQLEIGRHVDFLVSAMKGRNNFQTQSMKIIKETKEVLDKINERQIHAQAIDRTAAVSRSEKKQTAKRQQLKEQLSEEVFPINRITKGVMELFKSKGFQQAAAEMVAADLPCEDRTSLRAQFNTVLFDTIFTRRLYSRFYLGANASHNTSYFSIPMPQQMLKIKSLVYKICGFDAKTKEALDAGFKRKCVDTRTYRRNAILKGFGKEQKEEAEIYLYNDICQFIDDHTWWREKNSIDRRPPSQENFLKESNYAANPDNKYQNRKDKYYWDEKPAPDRDYDYMVDLGKKLDEIYAPRSSSERPTAEKRPRDKDDDDDQPGPSKRRKDKKDRNKSKRGNRDIDPFAEGGKSSHKTRQTKDKGKGKKSKSSKSKDSREKQVDLNPSISRDSSVTLADNSASAQQQRSTTKSLKDTATAKEAKKSSKVSRKEAKEERDKQRWKVAESLFRREDAVRVRNSAVEQSLNENLYSDLDLDFPPTQLPLHFLEGDDSIFGLGIQEEVIL